MVEVHCFQFPKDWARSELLDLLRRLRRAALKGKDRQGLRSVFLSFEPILEHWCILVQVQTHSL